LAKIKARLKSTSESWIMTIYFVMNLVKLAQDSFFAFLASVLQVFEASYELYFWQKARTDRKTLALKDIPRFTNQVVLHKI